MMKLQVSIVMPRFTRDVTLPVGNGTQTFKWLAFAAAYRAVNINRNLPRRDPNTLPLRTQLLPKNVYTQHCPFLSPDYIIKEHLEEGQRVIVDLYTSLEMDVYGTPILSPWAFIAFRHDERHKEERGRLIEEKKLEVETFRREKADAAMIMKLEIEKPKIQLMREVLESQLITDEAIAATVEEEWTIIKSSGILDNIIPDEKQQNKIRSFIQTYYVELNDMYKFYSAVNSGGGTHTLEYIELCKFLTETGILGESHNNAILRIFLDSHIKQHGRGGARPSIHSEIRRPEFFVSLIRIAILKGITLPKKELLKLRKKGHEVSLMISKLPNAPDALASVYEEYLSPVLEKMPAGSKMRAALASESVMILFYDNLSQLAKGFGVYAGESDHGEAQKLAEGSIGLARVPAGAMDVHQFGRFASDVGFVDVVKAENSTTSSIGGRDHSRKHSIMGNRSSSTITQKDVRQIFSASQHDNVEPNESEQKKGDDEESLKDHQELMVFSEFLEAVARLGVLKHHTTVEENIELEHMREVNLSHFQCIKLAVEHVCGMV